MARVDRILDIRPDANLPAWSLYATDELGLPVPFAAGSAFAVKVRTAGTLVSVAGSMTAHTAASLTGDNDLSSDVPSLRFTPTAASLALVPAGTGKTRAQVLVYVGTGDVQRWEFPARIVP